MKGHLRKMQIKDAVRINLLQKEIDKGGKFIFCKRSGESIIYSIPHTLEEYKNILPAYFNAGGYWWKKHARLHGDIYYKKQNYTNRVLDRRGYLS